MRSSSTNTFLRMTVLLAAIVVVVVAVVMRMRTGDVQTGDTTSAGATPVVLTQEEVKQVEDQKAALAPASPVTERYVHPTIGFSFEKPQGYSVGAIADAAGSQTLVVQPQAGGATDAGFQIYITPLDAPIDLTPTLIKSELPGTSVNNAQKIVLDSVGKGMMFGSNNASFGGKSYEIWFTGKGYLYQVTSYASFATTLQNIIGTWKF